jgi:membrane protein
MSTTTALTPIPGEPLDPPPKEIPDKLRELEDAHGLVGTTVGVGYRAFNRFSRAKASLLAAGTTYYVFLAMFSVIAFAYGITAALGADRMASYLTEAIASAFPGLLGDEGIDPAQLRSAGQTASIVGLIGLLYGGGGAVMGLKQAIHMLYGAPKDPRNYVVARIRAIGWLILIGPLILISLVASSITADFSDTVLKALNVDWQGPGILLRLATVLLTLGMNFLIVYLIAGRLGGIRPPQRALVIGSAAGAVVIEILKSTMALIVGFTIDKPQYGALAAPIGILFVLYLLATALLGSASLTAGIAERDVPLETLEEADVEQAQAAVHDAADEIETVSDD